MTSVLSAGEPLESPRNAIARRTVLLSDSSRADRILAMDCWYPTSLTSGKPSVYELLPGLGFTASAQQDSRASVGSYPLLVWSHGRTGTRVAYVMLCEALAARGYVVVASDHPGDTLGDWLLGAAVDDATNEALREGDIRFVFDQVFEGNEIIPEGITIDSTKVALAGHSYGGHTAFAVCGASEPDARVKAVAGLQSFTRTMRRSAIARIDVPLLMVTGSRDTTTPPATDADRVWPAVTSRDARRVDVERAGHQACSDVGLYLELAPQVVDMPEIVAGFVASMADNITGTAGDPWRPTVTFHAQLLGSWLDEVLDHNRADGTAMFDRLVANQGVRINRNS